MYTEDLCKSDMARRFLSNNDKTDATEDESEISDEDVTSQPVHSKSVSLQNLYMVALELRRNIWDYPSTWYEHWPPLSPIYQKTVLKKLLFLRCSTISWHGCFAFQKGQKKLRAT